jgi:hypothetical protein
MGTQPDPLPIRTRMRRLVAALTLAITLAGCPAALAAPAPQLPGHPPSFVVAQVRASIARAKDRHPITAQFVLTRRQAANEVVSGASVNSNQPVYLVVVKGSFTVARPGPTASGFMRVPVLTYVFDARTGRETDGGFGRLFPDLSRLGTVHNLMPYLRR